MDVIMMLERLGWTSLQAVLLAGLVWGVCRAVPSLGAAARCRLWWLVSLQAVMGLFWTQPLQLAVLPAPAAVSDTLSAGLAEAAYVHAPEPSVQLLASGIGMVPADGFATATPWWAMVLAALWLAGVLVMAWRTWGEWRHSRALLAAAVPCDDRALVHALQLAAEAHGLRRAPRLWMSAEVDAPQVVGPLRPVLLLPAGSNALQGDALDLALTHELLHLARRDLQWGLLPALAQHLFFFHPLLRLAVGEYAQAREEAVDAAVVAGRGERRQDYGRLLLRLGVMPRPHLGVASAAPSKASLKRRLLSLQQRRACPNVVAAALTVAVLAVGVLPLRLVAAPPPPPVPPGPPAAPAAPHPPAAPAALVAPRPPAAPDAPSALPIPATPAVPAAPAAPSPPRTSSTRVTGMVTHGRLELGQRPQSAHVLIDEDESYADGAVDDVQQARRDLGDQSTGFWFRQGDQRYVVRDRMLVQQMQKAYADAARIGYEQAELGRRQGELGARTGEQARQLALKSADEAMAAIGMADINREAAAEAARASRAAVRGARAAGHGAALADLASRQAALGAEQAALGRRQAEIHARAAREARKVIAQALADGRAEQH